MVKPFVHRKFRIGDETVDPVSVGLARGRHEKIDGRILAVLSPERNVVALLRVLLKGAQGRSVRGDQGKEAVPARQLQIRFAWTGPEGDDSKRFTRIQLDAGQGMAGRRSLVGDHAQLIAIEGQGVRSLVTQLNPTGLSPGLELGNLDRRALGQAEKQDHGGDQKSTEHAQTIGRTLSGGNIDLELGFPWGGPSALRAIRWAVPFLRTSWRERVDSFPSQCLGSGSWGSFH